MKITSVLLVICGLVLGVLSTIAWQKSSNTAQPAKYVTIIEDLDWPHPPGTQIPQIYVYGRVTPLIRGDSKGATYFYFHLEEHVPEIPAFVPVQVSSLATLESNIGTCTEGTATSVRSWLPRRDGCFIQDAPK